MTYRQDIIEFARKCASGSTVRIKQVELGQALLIAVDALEKIERKEAIECHFTKEGTALPPTPATDALKRIRSLPSA